VAIKYTKNYWDKQNSITSWELSTYEERKESIINFKNAQKKIAKGANNPISYEEMLLGKKELVAEAILSTEKSHKDYNVDKKDMFSFDPENISNSELYDDITDQIDIQAQVQFLQLYYDSYMNNTNSDAIWRLGSLKGSLNNIDINDTKFCELVEGAVMTRSNMSYAYNWNYVNQGGAAKTLQKYSSLGFPPYKFGANSRLGQKTNRMEKIYATVNDINSLTFDQDNFKVTREDVTLRDVGMKNLSDWINYLQYIVEGATGIVSTYLTEWDLSIYMQEGLMLPKVNGGPMDIYLNYRIKQDNPLADGSAQKYTDDKALCFNAVGSAVSKLHFDCMKNWRPSDFPLSAWWMPYLKDRDWYITSLDMRESDPMTIPYLSFYDDFVVNYPYDSQSDIREIFKHQDYLGYIARGANTMDNPFWSIFYTSETDSLSNLDVKMQSLLSEVAGADYGSATSSGKDLNYLKTLARKETLLNGGYYGGPMPVNQSGGLYGRTMVDNMMNSESEDQTETTMSGMENSNATFGDENNPSYSIETVADLAKSSISGNNKKDASQMSKMTGVNRFSPALYGGPHSSDYSPYHLRDYFKADSLVTHQVPKIGFTNISSNVEIKKDDDTDVEKGKYTFSPTKALSYLKEGSYSYYKKLVYCKEWINETFEGTVSFNRKTLQFDVKLPTNYKGSPIIYGDNKIVYKTKVYSVRKLVDKSKLTEFEKRFSERKLIGKFGEFIVLKVPVCVGKYYHFVEKTVRFYEMDDYPDVKWKIVVHKFLSYTANNRKNEILFNRISANKYGELKDDTKKAAENAGYVLTFDDPRIEEEIKLRVIQYNKGITDSPRYLYFCGCDNINDRYTKGPSYIFKAPVQVRYYENVTEKYKRLLWFTIKDGIQKTYMPYLYVDLNNTVEYFDLNTEVKDIVRDSEYIPSHLATLVNSGRTTTSPLQKMKTGIVHNITAWKKEVRLTSFLNIFSSYGRRLYNNGEEGDKMWYSNAEFGIEGVGILSGWQGIDTTTEKVETQFGDYDIHNVIVRKEKNFENIPLEQLPLNGVQKDNTISFKNSGQFIFSEPTPNMTYMSNLGLDALQTWKTKPLDEALKKAINKICTTIYFKEYDSDNSIILNISEPVKNFLSYCCTELNYLNISKDVFNTLNFENIRKVLLNNVDACVLKACGLQKIDEDNFVRIPSDKKHVLYNYWIDIAIQLFYDKTLYEHKRTAILEKYNYLISCLETTIESLTKITKKPSTKWTYNEWKQIMGQLYIQKENIVKNEIDEFFFAYLNILYMYRLYFVGKRFNKEDGTMWNMRQLESTIDLVHKNIEPPKSPAELNDEDKDIYNVIFYEFQNTTTQKRDAAIRHIKLDEDKICRLYVPVEYGTKNDFENWVKYRDDPMKNPKAREVIRLNVDGQNKYVFKPMDGVYQFKAKEWNDNYKNHKWNANHKDKPARIVEEYTECIFPIEWKPMFGKTPIRWNVLGSVNVDNLLEYSRESVTAHDLVCLTEEGSDFWTVSIPENLWPKKDLYKTKLYLKYLRDGVDIYNDVYTTVLGPFANIVSPIKSYNGMLVKGLQDSVAALT
jgi:hypothetical protein